MYDNLKAQNPDAPQITIGAETASVTISTTGNWGGLLTRILWFLSALLGASLPLTGYYIWIKHLVKKSKAKAEIRAV